MASISRRSVLNILVIAVLLTALPAAIRRTIQTGVFYPFSREFFQDMLARLSGPGRFRFILQPVVAIVLGARDGVKDARAGPPPFLWGLVFHPQHRSRLIKGAFASVNMLVCVAILLDVISQFLIFRRVNPGAALLLGPVLIGLPYSLSRAVSNRIARRRNGSAPVTPAG